MAQLHDHERERATGRGPGAASSSAAALVSAAERAADEILAEARADAFRLRAQAGADAELTRREADEDARAVVADARDAVGDVLHGAEALAQRLATLSAALDRGARLLLEDAQAAHDALRAEADAAAARMPATARGGRDARVLPFEPRPDFEIPARLQSRR